MNNNTFSRKDLDYGDVVSIVKTIEITPEEWEIYKVKYGGILSDKDVNMIEEYFDSFSSQNPT